MWAHGGAWFCPIWGLVFILILGFIIFRISSRRNYAGYGRPWNDRSDAILRERLAKGEIDEAEYQKLKDTLRK